MNNSSRIVEDFNTPPSIMYRITRQKANKEREDLNNTTNNCTSIDYSIQRQQNTHSSPLEYSARSQNKSQ